MSENFDVVVVGGGIAGSALAGKLVREGLSVLVLERQEQFRDRVRGECMMPWGVLEARKLDVEQLLLDAGGGYVTRAVGYDETVSPGDAEARAMPLSMFLEGVDGFLDVGHPQASEALTTAAAGAGATVVRGVGDIEITAGPEPTVRYVVGGTSNDVRSRIVVGADGRASIVRKQLGIELEETAARTMLSGLLVADLDDWPVDQTTLGTSDDVHFLVFPRPGGLARLYLGYAIAEKDRFTGADRVQKFLDAFRVDPLPLGDAVASATPAGPCAGHPGTNAWTDRPVAEGAVLVGDAAGWSDPLIGQGLSIALRDARSVADVLLAVDDWSADAFTAYVDERSERMRRIRVVVDLMTDLRCDFTPEGRARRAAFFGGLLNDPLSIALMVAMLSGAELAAPEAFEPENVARVRAMA